MSRRYVPALRPGVFDCPDGVLGECEANKGDVYRRRIHSGWLGWRYDGARLCRLSDSITINVDDLAPWISPIPSGDEYTPR